ncbi:MAG: alpha/beta hydrolase [Xanthomonadales bacterium]
MTVVLTLLGILATALAVFLVLAWLFRRGEDLSRYDAPVDPAAFEDCGAPDGPSDGHAGAVAAIEKLRPQVEGLSRGGMIRFARQFMEDIPGGRRFDCAFRPVEADGVRCEWVLAPDADPDRRVLYLHGGAFIAGSPHSHRTATCRFSAVARAAVLAVDYRLMPENARRDCIRDGQSAYRWLLENGPEGPAPAQRVYFGGDSAGGNLALVLSAWARDAALRQPDAVVALSPLTDSTYTSPSIRGNLATDTLISTLFGRLARVPQSVLSWMFVLDNRLRPANPLVSPVRGDLSRLPPTLLQVSESEMLYDDARRYVNKALAAGSPARLQSWPGLLHVWQLFYPEVPEAGEAWRRVGEFIEAVDAGAYQRPRGA